MPVKVGKFVYWIPRILSILFITFLAMFSSDVIEPGRSVGDIMIGLIMHNIPVFVLTGLIVIAWKHGGIHEKGLRDMLQLSEKEGDKNVLWCPHLLGWHGSYLQAVQQNRE